MTDIAIHLDNLSKLYPAQSLRAGHLGAFQQRHDTLRDALTGALARWRRNGPASTDHRELSSLDRSADRGRIVVCLRLASWQADVPQDLDE